MTLTNDQRESVGKHFDGDPFFEALQILGRGGGACQKKDKEPQTG
jgi:hypothetical protein